MPMKRLPTSVLVAILVVGLTATAAFAAAGPHRVAPQAEPTPVVVGDATDPPAADGTPDKTEAPDADESDAPESEAPESEAPEADGTAAPHPSNHGGIVSRAAQATTPAGCRNHGQYVSLVARGQYDPTATLAPGATPLPADFSPCATPSPAPTAEATPKPAHGKPAPDASPRGKSGNHKRGPK